jgi:hypothetical protein
MMTSAQRREPPIDDPELHWFACVWTSTAAANDAPASMTERIVVPSGLRPLDARIDDDEPIPDTLPSETLDPAAPTEIPPMPKTFARG